jgi:DHA1 family tetracycline resistance protein-like MFS transporter
MATFSAGMVFGPAGGTLLFAKWGFSAPFLAASALQLLTLIVTVTMLPESRSKAELSEDHVGTKEILATFANPRFSPILLQKLALSLALYGWYIVIALYLKGQLGFDYVATGRYFSLFAVINVIVNVFGVGRASKGLGDARMSIVGLAILILAFCFTPFTHTPLTVSGVMILFALGGAFANNGINAQISNAANEREQGTVLGVSSSLDSLSGILAPPLSTGVLSRYGSPYAGLASLVMAAISLILGVRNIAAAPKAPTDIEPDPVTPPLQEVS